MKKKRCRGFVTIEMAVVLGLYLTILGNFMLAGFKLYQSGETASEQQATMKTVVEICQWRRQLKILKEL